MNRPSLALLLAFVIASVVLTGCGTLSTDPAPGGISNASTGMNPYSIQQWQDRSIRQLAY